MSLGAGRYDDLCTIVREKSDADAAIVIIIGGNRDSGFSVQTHDPAILADLPRILELMASQMREDMSRSTQ